MKKSVVIAGIILCAMFLGTLFGVNSSLGTSRGTPMQRHTSAFSSRNSSGQKAKPNKNYQFQRPNGVLFLGDSRAAGSISLTAASGYVCFTLFNNSGAFEWTPTITGNTCIIPANANYGVSSTTSLNLTNRLFVQSVATTGNPTGVLITGGVDARFNVNSTAIYGAAQHPSNTVFLIHSVNDSLYPAYYVNPRLSMLANISTMDQLRHKTIFAANEIPRGTGTSYMESHAVSASTCTATNTAGFQDGSNLGVQGVFNATTGVAYTLVGSAPAIGQYSVSSGGVYTFNASDTITTAMLNYSYTGLTSAAYQLSMHDWWNSSAANFIESGTGRYFAAGHSYGVPGAQYNRPNLIIIDTWNAILDPSNANTSLRGFGKDSLHPTSAGSWTIAQVIKTAWIKAFGNLSPVCNIPTKNNKQIATANGSTTTFSTTLSSTFTPIQPGTLRVFSGTASPVRGMDNGAGTITGTGIVGTINYSTGALSVIFTSPPVNTTPIYVYTDNRNFMTNGMLDYTFGNVAATGIGASGNVPSPWTATAAGMGSATTAFSSFTDADGYPAIKVVITNAGGTGTNPKITISNSAFRQVFGQYTPGAPIQVCATITISAGPDGHLYGLSSVYPQLALNTSAVTKAGTASVTSCTFSGMQSNGAFVLTDFDLATAGGTMKYVAVSPTCDTFGFSNCTCNVNIIASGITSVPISATILISRVSVHNVVGASQEN